MNSTHRPKEGRKVAIGSPAIAGSGLGAIIHL
jgi:hypothetical protein